jgi:hypothetical protein
MSIDPAGIDRAAVERAFGHAVSSYDIEPIDPELRIHSVTGGLFRVRADGETLVLKIVRRGEDKDPGGLWVSGADPSHRNYWKREWLAFDSGILDALPGRLRAPQRALTEEHAGDECWIWMSDVGGRHGPTLTDDDYSTIGRDLGTTQGAFVARGELPDDEWLARSWLRGWVGACERFVDTLREDSLADDRLAPLRPLHERVLSLWDSRDRLLDIAESAPQTLVHCDFWPANLFVDDGRATAVDWSQIGIGGLAQDLDQVTLDPVWMQVRPDFPVERLEELVLPAYVEGLHESGAEVTEKQVRWWYAAAAGVHYSWLAGGIAQAAQNPEIVAAQERRFGRSFADLTADRARVVERGLTLGESALGSTP